VRTSLDNREARVLFAIAAQEMVLLHGFVKKTRTTPAEELDLAERRWKAWQGRQQGGEDE
jgi:phage-related protein